jgi:hypothetical protein
MKSRLIPAPRASCFAIRGAHERARISSGLRLVKRGPAGSSFGAHVESVTGKLGWLRPNMPQASTPSAPSVMHSPSLWQWRRSLKMERLEKRMARQA